MILWSTLMTAAAGGDLDRWTASSSLVLDGTVAHVRYTYDATAQEPTTTWGIQVSEALKGSVQSGWVEVVAVGQGMLPNGRMQDGFADGGIHLYPGERVILFAQPTADATKVELIGYSGPLLVAGAGPSGTLYAHRDDNGARHPMGSCGAGQGVAPTPLRGSLQGTSWGERAMRRAELTDWGRVCSWTTLLGTLRAAASLEGKAPITLEGVSPLPPGEHLLDGTVRAIAGGVH
jgi:hypothetical protein